MSPEVYILLKKLIFTSLGASNGDKTQRQLFHQLQSGHDEHERDIDKRRQGTFHEMSILGHRNHHWRIRKNLFQYNNDLRSVFVDFYAAALRKFIFEQKL